MLLGWLFTLSTLHFCYIKNVTPNVFVELLLNSFKNPEGFDYKGNYCDFGIQNYCDTEFKICLGLDKYGCVEFNPNKTFTNTNSIDFTSEKNENKLFVQEFKETYQGKIFINIEVNDNDLINNDLIDQFTNIVNINASHSIVKITNNKGKHNAKTKSTIDYSIRVYCSKNYFGKDCNKYCEVESSSNFTCNNLGERVCKLNWFNNNCTVFCQPNKNKIYKCDQKSGDKICFSNYYGKECDKYCDNKAINYICNNVTGEKICKPNFFGKNCEVFCDVTATNYYCNKTNGNIICNKNYFGKNCKFCEDDALDKKYTCNTITGEKECYKNYYGPNCTYCNNNTTYNKSKNYKCNNLTGYKECFSDFYGENCSTYCSAKNKTSNYICDKISGKKMCFNDYYGKDCSVYCNTNNNTANYICNNSTGEKECLPDYYGKNCSTFCSTNKETSNYICNEITGDKLCFNDYYGENCSVYCNAFIGLNNFTGNFLCDNVTGRKICFSHYYGENCTTYCNNNSKSFYCNNANGQKHCFKGWSGANCEVYAKELFFKSTTGLITLIFVPLAFFFIFGYFVFNRLRNKDVAENSYKKFSYNDAVSSMKNSCPKKKCDFELQNHFKQIDSDKDDLALAYVNPLFGVDPQALEYDA